MQIGRISFHADTTDPYFFDEPLCKYADPEAWFDDKPNSRVTELAISICGQCKHEVECAAYAIVNPSIEGIWGATTFADRQKIRKKLKINEIDYNIDDDNDSITNN